MFWRETQDTWKEKAFIDVGWTHTCGFTARIKSAGIDFLETGEPSGLAILSPLTVHQEFHAPVGAVAGRDINIQISFGEVLNKLANNLQPNQEISPEEKRSLVDRLKSLAENEWVRSIGTSVLADMMQRSLGIK